MERTTETFYKLIKSDKEQPTPCPRSGHCMGKNKNNVYIFGGFDEPGKTFRDLWRYNTATKTWCKMPDLLDEAPQTSVSSSMVLVNNNLFVFGGTSFPFSKQNSNELFLYDLTKQRWFNFSKALTTNGRHLQSQNHNIVIKACGCKEIYDSKPIPKYGQSMVLIPDHRIFIYSGTLGTQYTDELHIFNLDTFRWVEYKFCLKHGIDSQGRYKSEAIDHEDRIYFFGGSNSEHYLSFDTIDTFNLVAHSWEKVTTVSTELDKDKQHVYPEPRKAHSCVKHGDNVYLMGGMRSIVVNGGKTTNRLFNDVWILSLKSKAWSKISENAFGNGRYFHTSAITAEGEILTFGGVSYNRYQRPMRLQDLCTRHIAVPSLRHITWSTVVGRLQRNGEFNQQTFKDLRFPKDFLRLWTGLN